MRTFEEIDDVEQFTSHQSRRCREGQAVRLLWWRDAARGFLTRLSWGVRPPPATHRRRSILPAGTDEFPRARQSELPSL